MPDEEPVLDYVSSEPRGSITPRFWTLFVWVALLGCCMMMLALIWVLTVWNLNQ